jgi:hypothetical protein
MSLDQLLQKIQVYLDSVTKLQHSRNNSPKIWNLKQTQEFLDILSWMSFQVSLNWQSVIQAYKNK